MNARGDALAFRFSHKAWKREANDGSQPYIFPLTFFFLRSERAFHIKSFFEIKPLEYRFFRSVVGVGV